MVSWAVNSTGDEAIHIAILGIGEVGGRLARDLLAQGVTVSGWDPEPHDLPEGLRFADSNPDAAQGADLILSANRAAVAVEVAHEVVAVLTVGQVFADMNTASPQTKRQIDALFDGSPALFADVGILSPILPLGIESPTLVSEAGAETYARIMTAYGMPVEVLDASAGQAAVHKLLRSVFYKGLAAVVIEMLEAAEKLDLEDCARGQMMTILKDEDMIERFVSGSKKHAARRIDEMEAVMAMLDEIGVESLTSTAARDRLAVLLQDS